MIARIFKYGVSLIALVALALWSLESVLLPLYVGVNNEHYLPDLRGHYLDASIIQLHRQGFKTEIIEKPFTEELEPGTIVGMSPAPFTKVKEGRTIKLTVAQERADVIIPNFINRSLRDVILEIERLGLEQDTIMEEYNADFLRGTITYQAPRAGQMVKMGTPMTFMVSKGAPPDFFRVPDLLNLSLARATAEIATAGLKLGDVTYEYHPDLIPKTVIDQSLTPGMRLTIPARIDLILSSDQSILNR